MNTLSYSDLINFAETSGARFQHWGAFAPNENLVRLDEQQRHESEDLVNLSACLMLKHRGRLGSVAAEHIPGGGAPVAICRYDLTAAIPQRPLAVGEHL